MTKLNEYIEPKPNEELRSIFPRMDNAKFAKLKHDILVAKDGNREHVLKDIDVMPDGTIVEGYNRYDAVQELKKEGKLPKSYQIPVHVLANMNQIQDAKEYSWRMNSETRRQLTAYQTISAALNVWGSKLNQKEIGKMIGKTEDQISKAKTLKEILSHDNFDTKMAEFKKGLETGEIENFKQVLEEIQTTEAIKKEVNAIPNPTFKVIMTEKYIEDEKKLYSPSSLKKLETDIENHEHPKRIKNYYDKIKPVIEQIESLEKEYTENIAVIDVVSDKQFKEAADWLLEQRGNTEGYSIVVFYRIPKEVLP